MKRKLILITLSYAEKLNNLQIVSRIDELAHVLDKFIQHERVVILHFK